MDCLNSVPYEIAIKLHSKKIPRLVIFSTAHIWAGSQISLLVYDSWLLQTEVTMMQM